MHKKINNSLTKKFIQGLRPLANTLPKQIKKIIKKNGFNFSSVVDNWTKIIGNDFSDCCYPINIKVLNNSNSLCLVLNVIHGKELEIEYAKSIIIDKINTYFGYNFISKIELKIMNKDLKTKERILVHKNFSRNLNDIKNTNLKDKLNKLIKAFNEKK